MTGTQIADQSAVDACERARSMIGSPAAIAASGEVCDCAMVLHDAWRHAVTGLPRVYASESIDDVLERLVRALKLWRKEIAHQQSLGFCYPEGSSFGENAIDSSHPSIDCLSLPEIDALIKAVEAISSESIPDLDQSIIKSLQYLSIQISSTINATDGPHF